MQPFTASLSAILAVPYLAWGIYTLRVRFRYHEDPSLPVQLATLGAVGAFLVIELTLLRASMRDSLILYIFTALGLIVSAAALYGPMLVSALSQMLVDAVMPPEGESSSEPHFAPVDALERVGDFEGAYEECLVLARIFPKHAMPSLRAADNLAQLERYEEAAQWFERGLRYLDDPQRALRITNRLAEIYQRRLDRSEDAVRVLEDYVRRFPQSERRDSVIGRIKRIQTEPAAVTEPGPPDRDGLLE